MSRESKSQAKTLLNWAGEDRKYIYLSILLGIISGISTMAPYICVYKIIETLYLGSFSADIMIKYSLIVAISYVIKVGALGIGIACSHKGAYNSLFRVRCMIIEHMSKAKLGSLNERKSGEIKKIISEDIEKMELFLAHNIPEFFVYAFGPIAMFIYLFINNPTLALVSIIPIPIVILTQIMMFKDMDKRMETMGQSIGNLNSSMIEYIRGMRLIKAYNLEEKSYKKFADSIVHQNKLWNEIAHKLGPNFAIFVVLLESSVIFLLPIGGYMMINGSISALQLILFIFIGSLYLTELRPLMQLGENFSMVFAGVEAVQEILDIPVSESNEISFPKNTNIDFNDVSFSYDKRVPTLQDVNFNIRDGEKVAIVGKSGAGKSTIIQLLSRFYDVDKGDIKIGGISVNDIDSEELLQNISIVFQKPFLTRQSILENIQMGTKATLEEVKYAAKKAQIHDYIESLPEGYNTKIGEYGSRLSGGEKQRIAIARAILKNAPILVLDEATSAADPENQYEIDKAIENLCKNKTVIIVAHRLNIVNTCDKVMIVEDGYVSGVGTHEEMIKKNKYYKKAWNDYNTARSISYGGVM